MTHLTAIQASALADDVYALTKLQSLDDAYKRLENLYRGEFEFSSSNMLAGKAGGPGFLKSRAAFGFVLIGKKKFKGEAVIVFRGSQYRADWFSNFNVMSSRSLSGQSAHDGFNQIFKSMYNQLMPHVSAFDTRGIHTVHCVGHSLGGALATLCADWVATSYKKTACLYTFGQPRAGLYGFSSHCTTTLGRENIFRVFKSADPVPMLPPWPYMHTPLHGPAYEMPSPGHIIKGSDHDMGETYRQTIVNNKHTWSSLLGLKEAEKTPKQVESWLNDIKPVRYGFAALRWLERAMIYVLKKCLNGAAWLISQAATASSTLMDQLSIYLAKAARAAEEASGWVVKLMRKILQILGFGKAVEAADLTRTFIRSMLIRLHQRIAMEAQRSIDQFMVKGRSV